MPTAPLQRGKYYSPQMKLPVGHEQQPVMVEWSLICWLKCLCDLPNSTLAFIELTKQ